ncbi:unnamed protein product [Schistosoma guineensis]|uniref:Gamma-aminobutyric acid receptor-associated protein-like 2 n=3 Tax=Schistosoma TaxID=6181 RepID=A0AA85C433_9TREM|nr:putative gaba(A) receptor-associated protein [Schistosoma mansoni]XP_051065590.1 Gamma-aminobutyric acid receptor-associated protein-like 2, variant 2 [Schistosoma haematobium]CAH8581084.1 unnamed protein product [Schistosoma mattheei]CAH8592147.1 unnamed protein product [Schistosoma intercalatum]CAH8603578.1 unnamed protein product [Schistosoma guineensis]CAH8608109.1 unnamed protein product [Schistosoma curassoni]CAH8610288.1 unnamed protein product [Schistosoma bovis]CAH8625009.1 unnam|eukprot:XP_018653024.1 putative gaba(A) receptor-associated protein [Schistosoma mansoni]
MNFKFKETHTFEQRQQDSSKIKAKYPNRVPVVVERHRHSQIPDIDKHKFLVPDDVTVAQFMWIIRKRIDISSEKALFLFVEKNMPQTSATIGQLYHNFHDDDGFLYISYSGENSFGSGS